MTLAYALKRSGSALLSAAIDACPEPYAGE